MFSREPTILGQFEIDCSEMMFVQYMPIAMPSTDVRVPQNLLCFMPLIEAVISTIMQPNDYIYLTAKCMYIAEGCDPNRPGWHIDGFGTDDKNYVWSDTMPTEFCSGQDFNLSDDHIVSMIQMEQQARNENIKTYPVGSLLEMDSTIVHRVSPYQQPGMRTFCKISVSRQQYNLKGNSHNYLFDYKWNMIERTAERNHPIGAKP